MPMTVTAQCEWCDKPFDCRKIGAHRKRFCSATCKDRYHTASRMWVQRAIALGQLSVADLKALQPSCTTRGSANANQGGGKYGLDVG